jgi:small GTP-binding protein
MKEEPKIKLVVVGNKLSGKTSSLISYSTNTFDEKLGPSIFDYQIFNKIYDSKQISLILCDSGPGSDDYDKLRPLCYNDTDVFMICFSLIDEDSLNNIKQKWIPEIQFHCPNVPFFIVGNKLDLREDETFIENSKENENVKIINYEEGLYFANENGASEYCECSAKTQEGLNNVYNTAIKLGIKKKKKKKTSLMTSLSNIFKNN